MKTVIVEDKRRAVQLFNHSYAEVDPDLQTPGLKPTNFISSLAQNHPLFNPKYKEEISIYTNPLAFQYQEKIILEVQKLVLHPYFF